MKKWVPGYPAKYHCCWQQKAMAAAPGQGCGQERELGSAGSVWVWCQSSMPTLTPTLYAQ